MSTLVRHWAEARHRWQPIPNAGWNFKVQAAPVAASELCFPDRKPQRHSDLMSLCADRGGRPIGLFPATYAYPLLDSETFFLIGFALFFAPVIFHAKSRIGKPFLASDLPGQRKGYIYSGNRYLVLPCACHLQRDPRSICHNDPDHGHGERGYWWTQRELHPYCGFVAARQRHRETKGECSNVQKSDSKSTHFCRLPQGIFWLALVWQRYDAGCHATT
jgi:hypothetical protein